MRTWLARRLALRSLGNPATMPRCPGVRPVVLRPALSERFALFKLFFSYLDAIVCSQQKRRKRKLIYFRVNVAFFFNFNLVAVQYIVKMNRS